jgi:hypothetical protein
MTLRISSAPSGLIAITSDEDRGLLVAERTLAGALAKVPGAIAELEEARNAGRP